MELCFVVNLIKLMLLSFFLNLIEKCKELAMKLGQVLKRSRVLYFQFFIFAPAEKDSHTHNYKTQAYYSSVLIRT